MGNFKTLMREEMRLRVDYVIGERSFMAVSSVVIFILCSQISERVEGTNVDAFPKNIEANSPCPNTKMKAKV